MSMCMFTYTHTCSVCPYMCIGTYVHKYISICIFIYISIYISIHIHIYIYLHTHGYLRIWSVCVRGEGDSYQLSCEALMDRTDEQRIRTDLTKNYNATKKRGLIQSNLKNLHVSKDKPTRHLYGKNTQTLCQA